jgi:hypothetical protein
LSPFLICPLLRVVNAAVPIGVGAHVTRPRGEELGA